MKINCRINHAASCLFKVLAVGLLLTMFTSASLAFNLTWTNGNDTWTSTTAWQTNVFNIVTNNYTYWYTNGATTWTTNFCTLTNGIVPFAGNINIISNCTPGGVDTACAATPPLPGFGLGDACAGGTGAYPGLDDQAIITNAGPNISVSGAPSVGNLTVNSNAVVTLDATGNSLTVTNVVLIGNGAGANAKLYWAGGTLDNNGGGFGQVRIGDNGGNGELIVTNGTFVYDWRGGGIALSVGANSFSTGKLVVAGSGIVTPNFALGGTLTVGNGGSCQGSSLIVSNGGQIFATRFNVGSSTNKNNFALITGANSLCSNTLGVYVVGRGNWLIVSNGAKLVSNGGSLGSDSSFSTTIVTRASWLSSGISGSDIRVGRGSPGSTNNTLIVEDGGFISTAGSIIVGASSANFNNVFRMGGTGLMSTGFSGAVNNNSGSAGGTMYVTNAIFNTGTLSMNGTNNALIVLSGGTFGASNAVNVSGAGTVLRVDQGLVTSLSNTGRVSFSWGGGGSYGLFAITNGGKVLSEQFDFGGGRGSHTGLISGAGSVLSNYTGGAYAGTNAFSVGTSNNYFVVSSSGALFNDGTFSISSSNNYFAVVGGGRLDNTGTFNIGSTSSNGLSFCQVVFGGPGAPAIINNSGNLKIGTGTAATGNQLTVSNATLNAGTVNVGGTDESRINNSLTFLGGAISTALLQVRTSNTFTFSSGLLSVGATDFRTGANTNDGSAAPLVAGDGVNAAYYDLAAGGSGRHDFNAGGLVVTNAAFLRGGGNLVGNVTVLGTFVPGTAGTVGTIVASNNLTFGSSAVLEYDLGTSSDTVTVLGDLALGGAVNVTSNAGFTATTYTLFTHTGTVSGALSVGTMPAGYTGTVSIAALSVDLLVGPTGGGDAYTTWATTYGLSGGSASGAADPDGDGMSNTNEFLAGFNPTNSTARLTITSVAKSGSDMNVNYLGASGDSGGSPGPKTNVLDVTAGTPPSYTNNWSDTGLTNVLDGGTGLGQAATFVHTNGAAGPARYYRVRVLVP